ncbi:uncharacterized protein LOC119998684 [Tripterygium wilfordii]|uniref:uncharacterized protein LOC119998684 n=1 Tax=Tripterygium wilfordii TaxID=458696 RepID=UPI0018F7FBDF|nr:uncharacterized protein LOC119998684 [Tripterygium wilfordii]
MAERVLLDYQRMSSDSHSMKSTSATPSKDNEVDNTSAPLWNYVTRLEKVGGNGGNWKWQCKFCNVIYTSSHSRVKAHLLKIGRCGIAVCKKITADSVSEMNRVIEQAEMRSRPLQIRPPTSQSVGHGQPLMSQSSVFSTSTMESMGTKKRKDTSPLEKAFSNEAHEELGSLIARMFYSSGLPFHFARNPYYIQAFTFACNHNICGYVPPGYNALKTTLLQKEKARIERLLLPIKGTWKEKGVSIVSDGWTDVQRRPLINFMAASESGPIFLKAVNCGGERKDKKFIANLMKEIILDVGELNVVQVITDNTPVCKAAGLIIETQFPTIFWTPCVVHTLNLVLKNVCAAKHTESESDIMFEECSWIADIVGDVVFIKKFITTHSMRLAIYNKFVPLKLLAVAETRFASNVVMLRRFKLVKRGLQEMLISDMWDVFREDDVGGARFVKEKIFDDVWWDKIDYILSFTGPIYDMLRFVDMNKPTLHLIYEMWDSMIENVKKVIYRHEIKQMNEESRFFSVIYSVLVDRWTKSITPLHCLAHSLNPRYYSEAWLNEDSTRIAPHRDEEISEGRNKCLRKYFPNNEDRKKVNVEFARFSEAMDVFSEYDSLSDRGALDPKAWWCVYGSPAPLLQSLALKLLYQPCSSSCCERNWSTYSFIHSFKRNKIQPQLAEDLLFVHTNLRLLSRKSEQYSKGESRMWDVAGDSFDPLDGVGELEIANLSLDEPELEAVLFGQGDDAQDNVIGE